MNTIENILQIPLKGYDDKNVIEFLQRLQYGFQSLQPGDIKDPEHMYVWLYKKFKGYKPIERTIERIQRSTNQNGYRRTYAYLYQAITSYITNKHHGTNNEDRRNLWETWSQEFLWSRCASV